MPGMLHGKRVGAQPNSDMCMYMVAKPALLYRFPLWGRAYLRQWSERHLLQIAQGFMLPLLRGTELLNAYLRLLGAKIGHNVVIDTMDIADFDLIVIGDCVTVGLGATISATRFHAAQGPEKPGFMSLLPVAIGSGCTIAPGAKVMPGTVGNELLSQR